jgi:hypothetical protein
MNLISLSGFFSNVGICQVGAEMFVFISAYCLDAALIYVQDGFALIIVDEELGLWSDELS